MATRHNLCTNPAGKHNATGWANSAGAVDVTGEGFGRITGIRYNTSTFVSSATGAVSAGNAYTVSAYCRLASFPGSGTIYIEWKNAGGSVLSYSNTSWSIGSSGTVTRLSITATAPANAATAGLILDGTNFSSNTLDITQVLIEQSATADSYFDGDSAGAHWDGTDGNSASTLAGSVSLNLDPAGETGTARPLGRIRRRTLTAAIETSTAQSIARRKRRALIPAAETDSSQHLAQVRRRTLTRAIETSTGQPLTRTRSRLLTPAVETSTTRVLGRRRVRRLVTSASTEQSQLIRRAASDITITAGAPRRGWAASPAVRTWSSGTVY